MGNILYAFAVLLIVAWLVGFVGYNFGGLFHILLAIAIVAVLLRIIQGKKPL
ncbi:MAG: lmo0937 family membrane protein [Bacteroidia bacterium]